MKVICVNDKNKPSEIRDENWIMEGNVYEVIGVFKDIVSNVISFDLNGMIPDEPYRGYLSTRFIEYVPENLN